MSFEAAQDSFQLLCTAYLRCSTAFSGFISIKYKPNTVLFPPTCYFLSISDWGFVLGFFNCYPTALKETQYMSTSALIDSVKVVSLYIYIISAFLSFKFVLGLTFESHWYAVHSSEAKKP